MKSYRKKNEENKKKHIRYPVPFFSYLIDNGVEDDGKDTQEDGTEDDQDGPHPHHHLHLGHWQHREGTGVGTTRSGYSITQSLCHALIYTRTSGFSGVRGAWSLCHASYVHTQGSSGVRGGWCGYSMTVSLCHALYINTYASIQPLLWVLPASGSAWYRCSMTVSLCRQLIYTHTRVLILPKANSSPH